MWICRAFCERKGTVELFLILVSRKITRTHSMMSPNARSHFVGIGVEAGATPGGSA